MNVHLRHLSEELGIPFIVGSACYTGLAADVERDRWTWDAHYNSAYLVEGRAATARYDKVLLTPFGEVMPYISKWAWLEDRLLALGAEGMTFTLDASDGIERLPLPSAAGTIEIATPICFEDAVPRVIRRMTHEGGRRRAVVLVNLSNDGWFGDHDAGRAQHAHEEFKAGMPMTVKCSQRTLERPAQSPVRRLVACWRSGCPGGRRRAERAVVTRCARYRSLRRRHITTPSPRRPANRGGDLDLVAAASPGVRVPAQVSIIDQRIDQAPECTGEPDRRIGHDQGQTFFPRIGDRFVLLCGAHHSHVAAQEASGLVGIAAGQDERKLRPLVIVQRQNAAGIRVDQQQLRITALAFSSDPAEFNLGCDAPPFHLGERNRQKGLYGPR